MDESATNTMFLIAACLGLAAEAALAYRPQSEAEQRMLRDPYYRLGDPSVHPYDRLGL